MAATPGEPIPDAPLRTPDGGGAWLRGLSGDRPALLFVYKGDCGASELAAAVLPRFSVIRELPVVAISQDAPGEAVAFAAAHGWQGAVRLFVDDEPWPASEALGIASTPTWILLGRGGRVDRVSTGWSRDEANDLAAAAAALVGAAGPPPKVGRPEDAGPAFRPG